MIEYTTFYIYNEDGILNQEQTESLVDRLVVELRGNFVSFRKKDIDPKSTIFCQFASKTAGLTIYDHGYVFKVEGPIPEALSIVMKLDELIEPKVDLYISPSQRIVNRPNLWLKRGLSLKELSIFFDRIFGVDDYTRLIDRIS